MTRVTKPDRVRIDDVWLGLSAAAAALTAIASAGGLFLPSVYAKETRLWAVQGAGQDAVNLVVVVPLLLACAWLARRGSTRAALVWYGLLAYLIYSYVLYAFCVHFNELFLVYVGALGSSAYALAGAAAAGRTSDWAEHFASAHGERALSALFMATAVLFGALWLSEIVPAIASRTTPRSVIDAGLFVNPVHVLDLAFVLPAMAAASVLLWKRRPVGLVVSVPLAAFMTTMGLAIVGMAVAMSVSGVGSAAAAVPMAVLVVAAVWLTWPLVPAD